MSRIELEPGNHQINSSKDQLFGVSGRVSTQGSRLLNTVTKAGVVTGAALYVEGALNNGFADVIAGAAVAAISIAVYETHKIRQHRS